jgi:fructokinase
MAGKELVVCWGEILWDMFPDGIKLGGAPANVAYHLAAVGADVAMVSRVGRDTLGDNAIKALDEDGVDTAAVQRDPERPTGVVVIDVVDGDPNYTLTEGAAWERIVLDSEARRLVSTASALCFGTLSQRTKHGREQLERALAEAPPNCVRVCDPNLRAAHIDDDLLEASLRAADVVKINDKELRLVEQRFARKNPVAWLVHELGCKLVAITRGPRGCRLVTGNDEAEHAGFSAKSGGDNVGAGDAFTAVLIRLYLRGAPLATIAEAANRYGSYVASQRGATPNVPAKIVDQVRKHLG